MDPALKEALDALGMTQAKAAEAQAKALAEFRETSEQDAKKRDAVYDEKLAKLTAELDKFEPINEAINKAVAAEEARQAADKERQEQLDRIEARLNRPGMPSADEDTKAKVYSDCFYDHARKGERAFTADRVNVLQVSDDSAAGYFAPAELVRDILKQVEEYSPMRGLVTVKQTSHRSMQHIRRTSLPSAIWVGEIEDRSDTEGLGYGMDDIPVHEATMALPISNQMLEDSEFDIEGEMREGVADAYAKQEGQALISGSGSKRPQGFLNATGTISVNSGSATEITADGLIDLKYALKTAYAQRGSFIMNRQTLGKIRKLKDGNGQYLWASGLAAGRQNTIDGEPYAEMPDMPSVAGGAKPVAFGDWKRGYTLVDRLAMAVLRDNLTRAGNGQVLFRWRRRLGGAVTLAEAIAIMTVAAN